MSSSPPYHIENIYEKWSFIEDPEDIKYREKTSKCASTLTSVTNSNEESQEISAALKNFESMHQAAIDPNTGQLQKCGTIFEAHPLYDNQKCAECLCKNAYTRLFYHPQTFRSFYFCFSCSEDFAKRNGYLLIE